MTAAIDTAKLSAVEAVARTGLEAGTHPAIVMAVASSVDTLWTCVLSGEDEVDVDSIFLLASVTKPIVATGMMRLVERGRLSLDAPVAEYIPEFARYGKQSVTVWHLLTHTSGLEEDRWMEEANRTRPGREAFAQYAIDSYLNFEPGSRVQYNSLTFSALGEIISRVSGLPYPEYLREEVFEPLGMSDTGFEPTDWDRAAPVHDLGTAEEVRYFSSLAHPGGGAWSTAGDLVRFGQAFLNHGRSGGYQLLSPPAVEAMTRLQTEGLTELRNGLPEPAMSALGWFKPRRRSLASPAAFGHAGATGTLLWIDPVYDLVFVFLSNRWGMPSDLNYRALNAVYGSTTTEEA